MIHVIPALEGCLTVYTLFFMFCCQQAQCRTILVSIKSFFCFLNFFIIAVFSFPTVLTHMPFPAVMVAYLVEFFVFIFILFCFLIFFFLFILIFSTFLIAKFMVVRPHLWHLCLYHLLQGFKAFSFSVFSSLLLLSFLY